MKGKILRVLVGIFPSYLCLYADSLTMATDILLSVTLISAVTTGILIGSTDKDGRGKLIDILQDLWICHLCAFAICIFINY
jgi:hypothetical protein